MMKYFYETIVISQRTFSHAYASIEHKNFVTGPEQVYTLRLRKHCRKLNLPPYQAPIDSPCEWGQLANWLLSAWTSRDQQVTGGLLIQRVWVWCYKWIIKVEIQKPSCWFRRNMLLTQSRENKKLHTKSRVFSHSWCYLWSQGRSFETLINYMWWRCLKDTSVLINPCSRHQSRNHFCNKINDLRVFCSLNPAAQMGSWSIFFIILCILCTNTMLSPTHYSLWS